MCMALLHFPHFYFIINKKENSILIIAKYFEKFQKRWNLQADLSSNYSKGAQ